MMFFSHFILISSEISFTSSIVLSTKVIQNSSPPILPKIESLPIFEETILQNSIRTLSPTA